MEQIKQLDIAITSFIYHVIPHNYFFDRFFTFFSQHGYSFFIWIIFIAILLVIEERWALKKKQKNRKQHIIIYFLAAVVTTLVVVTALKFFFNRLRPIFTPYTLSPTPYLCPSDPSFPSGHSAIAFSCATILDYFDKKRKWIYYIVAAIVALSRIYLQCHYLLDIVTGGYIGFLISVIVLRYPIKKKS